MGIALFLAVVASIGVGLLSHHLSVRRMKIGAPQVPRLPAPVRRARRATLGECKPGDHVAVVGVIASHDDLEGPLSGRPCVAYDLNLIDAQTHERVGRRLRAQPIVIEDDGTRARVDATSAELRMWHDRPTFLPVGAQLAAMTALVGAPPSRPVYAYEGRLTRGQEILVIGVVQAVEAEGGAAYRTAPVAAALALAPSDELPLVVSDRVADREELERRASVTIRV
jgi:hypothetical protein